MSGSYRFVTFMCVWELKIEIEGSDRAEDLNFYLEVFLLHDFFFLLVKEKFAVSQI